MPTQVADAGVAIRGDLKPFMKDVQQTGPIVEALGKKLDKALSPRSLTANAFGKGPDELARSFGRAADSADEAFDAVKKLGTQNIDTAKARKYADVLQEISIEAQQTLADLRQLAKTDPRFNTPQIKAAADQLDRVGREAADSARSLRDIKGVGASTEFERMAHEAREAAGGLQTAGTNTDTLMGKLKGIKGVIAGLGLYLGAQQLLSFTGDAVESFGALQQSATSLRTIFGDSAADIEDWANRAAGAAGLSKREVQESASVMGQTLLNMGYDAETAAGQVVDLQQRAADMALAFGKDPQDAILAITAALRGERDTIEKFGVSLTQGLVDARIAALGLSTATPEAERYAAAVATIDLVMEQTAGSSGRFAGAADEVVGKMASLRAEAENGKAAFGEIAAGVEMEAFRFLGAVSDAGEGVATWIYENKINGALANDDTRNYLKDIGVSWEDYTAKVRGLMIDQGYDFERAVAVARLSFTRDIPESLVESGEAWETYQEQTRASLSETSKAVNGFVGTIVGEVDAGRIQIVDIAFRTPGEIAQAYADGRDAVKRAAAALATATEEGMSDTDRIAYLQGELTGDELTAGLNSNIPEVYNAAVDYRETIMAELWKLEHRSYVAGAAIPLAMARGIYANAWNAEQAARRLAAGVAGFLPSSEPKNPDSPLRGITKVGGKIVDMIAGGIYGSLSTAEGASAALAGVLSPTIPIGTMAGGAGGGVAASQVINYNLAVNGVPYQVASPEEAIEQLLALGAFGEGRLA